MNRSLKIKKSKYEYDCLNCQGKGYLIRKKISYDMDSWSCYSICNEQQLEELCKTCFGTGKKSILEQVLSKLYIYYHHETHYGAFIEPETLINQTHITPDKRQQLIISELIKERDENGKEFGIWITVNSNGNYIRIATSSDILSNVISFVKGENKWDTETKIKYNIWRSYKESTPENIQISMNTYKQKFKRMIKGK